MRKLVFLILALVGLALFVPRSRERIMGIVGPFGEAGDRRAAERALGEIALELRRAAGETGVYPGAGRLTEWLALRGRSGEDPWGSAYHLDLLADSFVVVSAGPDTRLRTSDDLRRAERRAVPPPGVLIVDHQPAPPPSSARRTAISKAREAAGSN